MQQSNMGNEKQNINVRISASGRMFGVRRRAKGEAEVSLIVLRDKNPRSGTKGIGCGLRLRATLLVLTRD